MTYIRMAPLVAALTATTTLANSEQEPASRNSGWVFTDVKSTPTRAVFPDSLQWSEPFRKFCADHELKVSTIACSRTGKALAAETPRDEVALFDKTPALLGTFKLDPKSSWIASEAGLLVSDGELTEDRRASSCVYRCNLKDRAEVNLSLRVPGDDGQNLLAMHGIVLAVGEAHCLLLEGRKLRLHDLKGKTVTDLNLGEENPLEAKSPSTQCVFDDTDTSLALVVRGGGKTKLYVFRDGELLLETPIGGSPTLLAYCDNTVMFLDTYLSSHEGNGTRTVDAWVRRYQHRDGKWTICEPAPWKDEMLTDVAPDGRIVGWTITYRGSYLAQYSDLMWTSRQKKGGREIHEGKFLPAELFR